MTENKNTIDLYVEMLLSKDYIICNTLEYGTSYNYSTTDRRVIFKKDITYIDIYPEQEKIDIHVDQRKYAMYMKHDLDALDKYRKSKLEKYAYADKIEVLTEMIDKLNEEVAKLKN